MYNDVRGIFASQCSIYLKSLSICVSRMTVNVARFGEIYDATGMLERTKYAMVRCVNIIQIG